MRADCGKGFTVCYIFVQHISLFFRTRSLLHVFHVCVRAPEPSAFGNEQEEIEWHHIPPEWRLWLRYARKVPPSDEEIRKGEAQRAFTLARAIEIEEDDQRQRSLETATGTHRREPSQDGQAARMAYLADRVHGRSAGMPPAPNPMARPKGPSTEGTGRGDSFKVGTWDPNAL